MSTLVASAVVATAMLSNCSWNSPGRNPYRGTVSEAVSRYIDIPAPARAALVAKIQTGRADDTVAIMRDTIVGKYDYSARISDMHFGQRTVCGSVTRDAWTATRREPAKVYCADNHCLIVPQICGNISRVQRIAGEGGGGGAAGGGAGSPVPAMAGLPRAAEPGPVRVASPDDVAAADAVAQFAAGTPDTVFLAAPAFASPFGAGSYSPDLSGRNPNAGSELTLPSPVPEPATIGMLGGGLALLFGLARLRPRRASRK